MTALLDRIGHEAARLIGVTAIAAYALLVIAVFAAACLSGCGATARISTASACAAVIVAVGESAQSPERALADVQSVEAVCLRLHVAADAGTP